MICLARRRHCERAVGEGEGVIVLEATWVLYVPVPAHILFSGMLWVAGIEESDVSRPKTVVTTHSVLTLGFIIATIRTLAPRDARLCVV